MLEEIGSTKKWYLSIGKCVGDELFIFDSQCKQDHPSGSLIMDVSDENYTLYNVFTQQELEEITNYEKKSLPKLPSDLKYY